MRNVLASICLLALAAVASAQGYEPFGSGWNTPGSALNRYPTVPFPSGYYYGPYQSPVFSNHRSLDSYSSYQPQQNNGYFSGYVNGNYIHGSTQRVGSTTYIHGYNNGQWFNGRVNNYSNGGYLYGQ